MIIIYLMIFVVKISEAQLCSSGSKSLMRLQTDGCDQSSPSFFPHVSYVWFGRLRQLGLLGIFLHLYVVCPHDLFSTAALGGPGFLHIDSGFPRCGFRERENLHHLLWPCLLTHLLMKSVKNFCFSSRGKEHKWHYLLQEGRYECKNVAWVIYWCVQLQIMWLPQPSKTWLRPTHRFFPIQWYIGQ